MGDLAVPDQAVDHHDTATVRLDERSVVGSLAAGGVRGPECRRSERLRGLDRDERVSHRRVDDDAVVVDHLDRVRNRNSRHGRVGAIDDGRDHPSVQRRVGQWPGSVVYTDHVGVEGHGRQSSTDARTPGVTAGDTTFALDVVGRHDDDHAVGHGLGDAPRTVDHPLVSERLVLLGAAES